MVSDIKFVDFKAWINIIISGIVRSQTADIEKEIKQLKDDIHEITQ